MDTPVVPEVKPSWVSHWLLYDELHRLDNLLFARYSTTFWLMYCMLSNSLFDIHTEYDYIWGKCLVAIIYCMLDRLVEVVIACRLRVILRRWTHP